MFKKLTTLIFLLLILLMSVQSFGAIRQYATIRTVINQNLPEYFGDWVRLTYQVTVSDSFTSGAAGSVGDTLVLFPANSAQTALWEKTIGGYDLQPYKNFYGYVQVYDTTGAVDSVMTGDTSIVIWQTGTNNRNWTSMDGLTMGDTIPMVTAKTWQSELPYCGIAMASLAAPRYPGQSNVPTPGKYLRVLVKKCDDIGASPDGAAQVVKYRLVLWMQRK